MALITSAGTGLFNTGATWNGGVVPATPNTAVIQNGHVVTIDASATLGPNGAGLDPNPETDCSFIVRAGGTLVLPNAAVADYTWALQGPIKIEATGIFQVGDSFASPFPSTRVFTINWAAHAYENWIAGALRLYGCVAYHMASATSTRSRLVADSLAGAGVTIRVADAVDWQTNDYVMIGTGGDPAHAATGCELVQITRVDASTFTANLASNHFGGTDFGDVVIHATRNIIINGTTAQGFSLVTTTDGTVGSSDTVDLDINWCRLNYAGTGTGAKASAISLYENNTSGNRKFINPIMLRGNLFVNSATSSSYQIGLSNSVIQQEDRTVFAENHAYNTPGIIYVATQSTGGHLVMGALSCINSFNIGINTATPATPFVFDIEDFTYVCDGTPTNSARTAISDKPVILNRFKIHRCYRGLQLSTQGNYHGAGGGTLYRISNGEIFSASTDGIYLAGTDNFCPHFIFKGINIRNHTNQGLTIYTFPGKFVFMDCLIDDCAQQVGSLGAVQLGITASDADKAYRINWINVKWGSVVPNYRTNMRQAYLGFRGARNIFQNCHWEPQQSSTTTDTNVWSWYIQDSSNDWIPYITGGNCAQYLAQNAGDYAHANGKVFHDIIYFGSWAWTTRVQHTANNSFEFVNSNKKPMSLTSTVQALVCGGGEILKYPGALRDGTVNRALRPFYPVHRQHITKANPIRLALNSGETISVSLYLRKNISQESYRLPKIHLSGCGIHTEAAMPNTQSTWEKLTVSGTAVFSGIADFWISCFAEPVIPYTGDPTVLYNTNLYPSARGTDTSNYFWMFQPCNPGGLGYCYYNVARPAPPACTVPPDPLCQCYISGTNCGTYGWDYYGYYCPFPDGGPSVNLSLLVDGLEVDIS